MLELVPRPQLDRLGVADRERVAIHVDFVAAERNDGGAAECLLAFGDVGDRADFFGVEVGDRVGEIRALQQTAAGRIDLEDQRVDARRDGPVDLPLEERLQHRIDHSVDLDHLHVGLVARDRIVAEGLARQVVNVGQLAPRLDGLHGQHAQAAGLAAGIGPQVARFLDRLHVENGQFAALQPLEFVLGDDAILGRLLGVFTGGRHLHFGPQRFPLRIAHSQDEGGTQQRVVPLLDQSQHVLLLIAVERFALSDVPQVGVGVHDDFVARQRDDDVVAGHVFGDPGDGLNVGDLGRGQKLRQPVDLVKGGGPVRDFENQNGLAVLLLGLALQVQHGVFHAAENQVIDGTGDGDVLPERRLGRLGVDRFIAPALDAGNDLGRISPERRCSAEQHQG